MADQRDTKTTPGTQNGLTGQERVEIPVTAANAAQRTRRWPAEVPDVVWGPLAAAGLLIVIGAFGVITSNPLLFPSLGPTAFLQTEDPDMRMARFYNTFVGHMIGLFSGLAAVFLLHANTAPSAMTSGQLSPLRVFASALAIALTIGIGVLLRASHPPASATTLLVALGGFKPDAQTMLIVVIGILMISVLGEGLRRARLGKAKKAA